MELLKWNLNFWGIGYTLVGAETILSVIHSWSRFDTLQ